MQVLSPRPLWLIALVAGTVGLVAGRAWAPSDPLTGQVLEALVLQAPEAERDARRLRWLAHTADEPLASWAREELAQLSAAAPVAPVEPPRPAETVSPTLFSMVRAPVPSAAPRPLSTAPVEPQVAGFRMPSPPVAAAERPTPPAPRAAPKAAPPAAAPKTPAPAPDEGGSEPRPEAVEPTVAPVPDPPPPSEPEPEPEPVAPPPPPPPSGSVTPGTPTLYGDLDPVDVAEALATRMRRWKVCYDDALTRDADATGVVELAFSVTSGHVTGLEVGTDEVGDRKLTRCLSQVARMLHFEGEGEVVLPLQMARDDLGGTDQG